MREICKSLKFLRMTRVLTAARYCAKLRQNDSFGKYRNNRTRQIANAEFLLLFVYGYRSDSYLRYYSIDVSFHHQ